MTNEQRSWKERLVSIGIPQAELARRLNLYKPILCNYLNLKSQPLAETHQKIENEIRTLELK